MEMNHNDKGRTPDVSQLHELGKPTSQKTKASSKRARRRTTCAEHLSTRSRRLPLNPAGGRGGNHASQCTFFCVASASGAAYSERLRVCHLGGFPVRTRFPEANAWLASVGRLARGYMWTTGWTVWSVDDFVLPQPSWRRRAALCIPAPVWVCHGLVHPPWVCCDTTKGRDPAQRMDAARLRYRAWRRYADANLVGRGIDGRPAE